MARAAGARPIRVGPPKRGAGVRNAASGYIRAVERKRGLGAAAAMLPLLLSGCSAWNGDDGRDHDPTHRPGYAAPAQQPPTEGTPNPGRSAHSVRAGSRDGRTAATFTLVSGADVVRVRVVDVGADLVRMATAADSKVAPAVDVQDDTVVATLNQTGQAGPAVVDVLLSDDLAWNVRLAGGAADEAVDLNGGPGGNVDLEAGAARAEVALPAGSGTQRITMSGGAGQLVVRLGGSAPVRVAANGGAGSVVVDGQQHVGVSGGSVWTPDGWEQAQTRYDVDATAGVSALTVERMH